MLVSCLFPLYSISLVCGMYTMLPKPTPQLTNSICSFRPLSSCSPHWNSTILSIPASLVSTVPCLPPSLLLSRLLSCSLTVGSWPFIRCLHLLLLLPSSFTTPKPTMTSATAVTSTNYYCSCYYCTYYYGCSTNTQCVYIRACMMMCVCLACTFSL